VNIITTDETIPKARNTYSVGNTAPRSPDKPLESCQTTAPAASPARVATVRDPEATSSRFSHVGHAMSFVHATVSGAGISVLQ
jgi:hypothetical protein